MKYHFVPIFVLFVSIICNTVQAQKKEWVDLIYKDTLLGWSARENPESFKNENGVIVCHGERAHLYYQGPISNYDFVNFELKATVKTEPGSNSGIYFHTFPQDSGWPEKGFEVQINNSSPIEKRKTGSLYNVVDTLQCDVKDNEWFDIHIIVNGKKVEVYINDNPIVNFTEPTPPTPPAGMEKRILSSGTFALQAHDPDSKVYFKDIKVKLLDNEN